MNQAQDWVQVVQMGTIPQEGIPAVMEADQIVKNTCHIIAAKSSVQNRHYNMEQASLKCITVTLKLKNISI